MKLTDGTVYKQHGYVGCGEAITQVKMEHVAMAQGLEELRRIQASSAVLLGSAQNLRQMRGTQRSQQELAKSLYGIPNFRFHWIPRERNREAESWAIMGLCHIPKYWDKGQQVVNTYQHEQHDRCLDFRSPAGVWYTVTNKPTGEYTCTCEGFQFDRLHLCKHVAAAHYMAF